MLILASFAQEVSDSDGGLAWLTSQGTLSRRGSWRVQDICAALNLHPADCADDVNARRPPFDGLLPKVAAEANLLLRKCPASTPQAECREIIENARYIRDAATGEIKTDPPEMVEDQESTFTVTVERREIKTVQGQEALPDPAASAAERADGSAPMAGPEFVRFTRKTCFQLDGGDSFAIRNNEVPQCPPLQEGGAIAFKASWKVTPLKAGPARELEVYRVLYREEEEIGRQRAEPFPARINVKPAPTLAERLIAFLTAWTGVAEEARKFVIALEALLVAIAGMSIWSWWRRRGASSAGSDQGTPIPAPAPASAPVGGVIARAPPPAGDPPTAG